jgi:hypothetical protein
MRPALLKASQLPWRSGESAMVSIKSQLHGCQSGTALQKITDLRQTFEKRID